MRCNFVSVFTVIIGLTAATFCSSQAAEINLVYLPHQSQPAISVSGPFDEGDGTKFAAQAARLHHGVVMFNSPGGVLGAGLDMGRIIRRLHLATYVTPTDYCTSACAFAWLAGAPRLMGQGSRIGFHGSYTEDGGRKRPSAAGNALATAYMTALGLSGDAILYLEHAPPTDITWLTISDAQRFGIDVKRLSPNEMSASEWLSAEGGANLNPPSILGTMIAP